MTLLRIQRKRTKGSCMPPNTVSVTRPGRWGNPFVVGASCDRAQIRRWGWEFRHPEFVCEDAATAQRRFRGCLYKDEAIHPYVREQLRGKNLACFCKLCDRHKDGKPFGVECTDCDPCHADPLLEIANLDEPCSYCADGARTGLPGNACENCMNTGLKYPEYAVLTEHKNLA